MGKQASSKDTVLLYEVVGSHMSTLLFWFELSPQQLTRNH